MGHRAAIGRAICLMLIIWVNVARAAKTIVDDPPREPQDERQALHVPPGFEVQLVASEPDIHKPINIAFDDRGRLWVTDTIEYPFPAAEGAKTRDTLKVLEDFDENGKARKITTFADNLNIPIGVLPLGDNGALVYSIPSIWKVTDTNGTGRADKRDVVLGTFAHDDTHGMTGSFNEGFDGWIYAVHGFKNTSTLKASDGSSITLNSGNTYRFKKDGSHVEPFTHGQVNPFGMCFDPQGNLYSSDCETKPIALLLRGAYYPSFGKPDDGLGFAPEICDHMYGSTAIAGLCEYVAEQFPAEYRNRMFVGNVVTGRINDAKMTPRGSGVHADDAPDFVVSDDAWFRPVCIKLGPDGALYVADFYNRIIGHYEVDLHHPGRDKQRGRVWRIVYTGKDAAPAPKFDLTRQSIPEVVDALASPNFTVRMLATNRLADVIGQPAVGPLKEALANSRNPVQKAHALWALYRLGGLEPAALKEAAADKEPVVRTHAMRILGEMSPWAGDQRELVIAGLRDADPVVRRTAADALGVHADFQNIRPLLDLQESAASDPFLVHTVRIALRDQLQLKGIGPQLASTQWSPADERNLADAAAGATNPEVAAFLLHYVRNANEPREKLAKYLRTIVEGVPEDQVEELATFVSTHFGDDIDVQLAAFKSVQDGLAQRGVKPGEGVQTWGSALAGQILGDAGDWQQTWTFHPIDGSSDVRNPWVVQMRASADGNASAPFFSSLVRGETWTGVARSGAFTIPPKLSFYLAGHNGPPPKTFPVKNVVRLRDAKTGEVLAEQAPPRNDVAQRVDWDLQKVAGREGYFEAVDADNGKMYAWLAFGRFDPPVLRIAPPTLRLAGALHIVESLHLSSLGGVAEKVLAGVGFEPEARVAAAKALGGIDPGAHVAALAAVVRDGAAPDAVREAAANALGSVKSAEALAIVVGAMHSAPQKTQLALAKSLAATPAGADALLNAIREGKASPRVLQDLNVKERLNVAQPANLEARIAELTRGLPPADAEIQRLIDRRAAGFNPAQADASRGRAVFQKTCAVCHMVGGQGAHVGPQLDGIGARGVPRLCEDILDPSRNVDAAFRYSTFVLADGTVVAGIPRHEEGQSLTVADSTGKEVTLDTSKITRRVESQLSLMPSNFGEVIPPAEFNDLLSYLLSTKP